jgi:hypothetical protein
MITLFKRNNVNHNNYLRSLSVFISVFIFLGLSFLFSLLPTSVPAATVEPGSPSTLEVQVPQSSRAGASFTVTIIVRDGQGNVVTDYSELDREILLRTTGSGNLSRSMVDSDQFENGRVSVDFRYDKAGKMQILAREEGNVAAGQSPEMTIRPGKPAKFRISHPSEIRAGQSLSMTIEVYDEFGNRVEDYGQSTNGLRLETTGLERPRPEFIPADDFNRGRLKTSLSYNVAESMRMVLIDQENGVRSLSDTILVRPASISQFTMSVPDNAQAGTPFRVAVEARDKFGNIVTNYSEVGQGVELTVPGGRSPQPSYLAPDQFEEGVAFAQVIYNRSGPIRIRAQDRGSSVEGESSEILLEAGKLDHYSMKVPNETSAGKTFTVTIHPRDQFGNLILNYSDQGDPVVLSVRGQEDPRRIVEPSDFSDGSADVDFSYTQAESIRLEAMSQTDNDITGQSKALLISPGKPGDIQIRTPESVQAGGNFKATLTLTDEYGNIVKETSYLSGKIRVSLVDGSSHREETLTPAQFTQGQKELVFRHEIAEKVSVFAEYRNFNLRVKGPGVDVRPASFDHVAVSAPGSNRAGSSFKLGITLLDRFENELREVPETLSSVQLVSSGSGSPDPRFISRADMTAPSFTVDMKYFVAESTSFKVLSNTGKRLGVSPPVRVQPAELDAFNFDLPDRIRADQEFTLHLEAKDAYENRIYDLGSREGMVRLDVSGGTGLSRERIQFSEFSDGVAKVLLEYHQAERIELTARTNGVESTSSQLRVEPGRPDRYEVLTQDRVQAGRPFPAVVRVFDRYGNPVTDLPPDFSGVKLSADGSTRISPKKLDGSLFQDGEASVFLGYPKTGQINVQAQRLESSLEVPVVDRFYLNRDVDTAEVYVLSSHKGVAEIERSNRSGSNKAQVEFQPANMSSDARKVQYDQWFLKELEQRQTQFGSLPTVRLSLFGSDPFTLQTNRQDNLVTIRAMPKRTSKSTTLRDVQELMQDQDFEDATEKLNRYLDENPADQEALQLRLRLKRLKDLIGS